MKRSFLHNHQSSNVRETSRYYMVIVELDSLEKLGKVIRLIIENNLKLLYMYIKSEYSKYVLTLVLDKVSNNFIDVLSNMCSLRSCIEILSRSEYPDLIIIDSESFVKAVIKAMTDYGEIIIPFIHKLAHIGGSVKYDNGFTYIAKPIDKFRHFMDMLISMNWLGSYEIKKISKERTEILIENGFESRSGLQGLTYLKAYIAGFLSRMFKETYTVKEEKIDNKRVIIKIMPHRELT
ncbi:MAG: hypothetical protein B6V02_00560 [Thermoprotei archaeon ex4572_64]|nr:MAG: hypothetical protein B6V02_00560 [Thermoprotei archaeon ex4572_64]